MRVNTVASHLAALLGSFAIACVASAQDWPTQRVTLIVPYGPGGPTDTVARVLAPIMERTWKQPFLVENRPGAGALVGTAAVAQSRPDGYTLLFNGNGVITAKFFTKELPYNPADLKPVVELGGGRYLIVTGAGAPFKTLSEMVAYGKKNPKAIHFGAIPFTLQTLDHILLARRLGIELTEVGYNSATLITTALLRNELQMSMSVAGQFLPHVQAGKIVGLAVTGPTRNPQFPDVPTAKEVGFDVDYGFDFGIWIPTKTPDSITARISKDIAAAVRSKEYGDRLKTLNFDVPADPAAWPASVDALVKDYGEIVKQIGFQPK
jgi:tripartite-type tricarboxylate transporter receptor subunit TctC